MKRVSLVLALIIGAFLVAASIDPVIAGDISPLTSADQKEIRATVAAQFAAFRRGDSLGAFALSSSDVKKRFRTPQRFMAMVRDGYSEVFRPLSVIFLDVSLEHGFVVQRVLVTDTTKRSRLAVYIMQPAGDGQWRIDGCILMDPQGPEI